MGGEMRRRLFLGLCADDWRAIYASENPLAEICRKAFGEERFAAETMERDDGEPAIAAGLRKFAKLFESFG
jgi:hypothetical protein